MLSNLDYSEILSFGKDLMSQFYSRSTTWYYTCHDMYASATSSVSGGSNFRVQRIWVGRGTGNDIFVDSVFIGRSDTVSDDGELISPSFAYKL